MASWMSRERVQFDWETMTMADFHNNKELEKQLKTQGWLMNQKLRVTAVLMM